MPGPENTSAHAGELDRQLRLFCYLMLGSADGADKAMRQIYQRASEYRDTQQDRQSERIRVFSIAVDMCRARNCSSH